MSTTEKKSIWKKTFSNRENGTENWKCFFTARRNAHTIFFFFISFQIPLKHFFSFLAIACSLSLQFIPKNFFLSYSDGRRQFFKLFLWLRFYINLNNKKTMIGTHEFIHIFFSNLITSLNSTRMNEWGKHTATNCRIWRNHERIS